MSEKMPYPGLRPFRRDEAEIFFGREEQVDELLKKLGQNRFLAVTGPSGCGKSSLVAAGLIPTLELGLLENGPEYWRIAHMRPGASPMKNLARALLSDGEPGERGPDPEALAFLLATLSRGPLGLSEALDETPLPDDTGLLILVDQFEEIFRYRREAVDDAEAFVDLLLHAAERDNVYAVITMRSDFLGDCALFPGLPEAMNESQYLTPRLTRDQRTGAIVGPATMSGGKIEPELAARLLNDMGADPDQLPVLQHVLMRMWTVKSGGTMTIADYEDLGGMGRALSNHADEAFDELGDADKPVAETLFKCLCERADLGRDTRRPVSVAEVADVADASREKLIEVIDAFRRSGRSFLTVNADDIIDISHESLIRQWERLREWAENEANSAEMYRRLAQTARLRKEKKAELWRGSDLDNAAEWKENQAPAKPWADRYDPDFDLAMEFLAESEKQRETERRREEEARQLEISRVRKKLAYAVIALLIAACLAAWGFWERDRAVSEKKRAETIEKERTEGLFESYLTHASLQARLQDYQSAKRILEKSRELDPDIPAERRHARDLTGWFAELMGGEPVKTHTGAGVPLFDVAVRSDGKLLAATGEKGMVALFDAESGNLVQRFEGHKKEADDVTSPIFHPENKWMATGGYDQRIILWSIPEGEIIREWKTPGRVWPLALSKDGKILASGGTDGNITLWNTDTGENIRMLKGHKDSISGLDFSPNGRLLAAASYDDTASIWEVETGKRLHPLRGHGANVQDVAFHPDGKILATSSSDKRIILWDVDFGRPFNLLQGHTNIISGISFTESGDRLVSASMDRTLRIWDTDTGVTLRVLQGHDAGVNSLAVKGHRLFSTSHDGTVRQWDLRMDDRIRIADMPGEPKSSAISPDGTKVAVGLVDSGLYLYSLPEIELIWEKKEAHTSDINRIVFSHDGEYLATVGSDKTAKLWQTGGATLAQTFEGHTDTVYGIDFSPDGKTIASASFDGQIGIFEIGEAEGRFYPAHEGGVHSASFDSTGKYLVSSGDDGKPRLWDITTGELKPVRDFPKSVDRVAWAAISPDGNRVAAVGRYSFVHIFDVRTGEEIHKFIGHENMVYRAAFTPDGGQVATVSADGTIRFWDVTTKEALFTLRLPAPLPSPSPLWDFDFRCTPTGCWIAVPLTRGKLVVYRMDNFYYEE